VSALALARALPLQAEDPSAGTLSAAGFVLISILLAGALAAVAVPTLVRLRARRQSEQRLGREARIAASGDPRFDPAVLAQRIRATFPGEVERRGGDTRLPDGRGRLGRPRRRRELWRADLDGHIVATAPADVDAEDLTAPPLPRG